MNLGITLSLIRQNHKLKHVLDTKRFQVEELERSRDFYRKQAEEFRTNWIKASRDLERLRRDVAMVQAMQHDMQKLREVMT